MKETWIIGIHIPAKSERIEEVQKVLTKFGCSIRTRLGLHDTGRPEGEQGGIILLELTGDPVEFKKLERALRAIPGQEIKKMVFTQG
jgi:hypothetical protein